MPSSRGFFDACTQWVYYALAVVLAVGVGPFFLFLALAPIAWIVGNIIDIIFLALFNGAMLPLVIAIIVNAVKCLIGYFHLFKRRS
ncbi:MAG: hypothetical protein ABI876_17815, partial [Bacteroidota bacterium]